MSSPIIEPALVRLFALPSTAGSGGIHTAKMAWFVRLRWLAVAGMTAFPPFGRYVMGLRLTLWPFMATAAFVGAYNAALHLWGRSILKSDYDELRARRHWSVQVLADLFALTLVGVGIPTADLPHIFEEFYRAANVRREGTESTGLGLAIAEEVVKSHRGTISVESKEGKGTAFVIVLPRRAEDERQD